jgi:UTP--glucose-1-phosphate uridylyltransferase
MTGSIFYQQNDDIPLVIPAAGLGSRFFPITWGVPKELLPVNNKPVLHYLLFEALKAKIKKVICITAKRKESLISYLTYSHNQSEVVLQENERERLEELHVLNKKFQYSFCMQGKPNGVGDAILKSEDAVKSNFFAIAYPDDLLIGEFAGLPQMMEVYKKYNCSVFLVEKVDPDKVHRYGVIGYSREIEPGLFVITKIVEKPIREEAPSFYAIIGRYIVHRDVFVSMKRKNNDRHCNIIAFNDLIQKGYTFLATTLVGERYDIGTVEGWLNAVKNVNHEKV